MPKFTLKDADIEVAGVNISDHVKSVTVHTERDKVDFTAMGANNKEYGAGLGDATITCEVYQDNDSGEINATMWPLSQSDTPFSVRVKASSAAASATNPVFVMDALLFTYDPISGEVGAASMTELEFTNASQDGLQMFSDDSSS